MKEQIRLADKNVSSDSWSANHLICFNKKNNMIDIEVRIKGVEEGQQFLKEDSISLSIEAFIDAARRFKRLYPTIQQIRREYKR